MLDKISAVLLRDSISTAGKRRMIREQFKRKLERRHTKLVLIWLAFVLANFHYVWFANHLAAHDPVVIAPGFASKLRTALWLFAAADIWALYGFWKKRIFTRQAFLAPAARVKIPAALRGHASPVEEKAAAAVSLYFLAETITFAFAAAIAIFGFALVFVGRYMTDQYLLTLLSLGILLYEFPSKSFLQQLVREVGNRGDQTERRG